MATGGKNNKNKDIKSDDPSIIGTSHSHPGSSGKHGQQNRNTGTYSEEQQSRHRQDRQTSQNMSRKQQRQTPNTHERRNQEHWDVPQANSRQSPLARDLFGAENGPNFEFNFQVNDPYGGGYHTYDQGYGNRNGSHNSGYRYGRQNNERGGKNNRQNRHGPGNTGQSSKHHNQNDRTPQSSGQNAGAKDRNQGKVQNNSTAQKTPNSAPNISNESDRKVKFIQTLMKNGQKAENLTVTLSSANDVKKVNEKKSPDQSAAGSSKKDTTSDQAMSTNNKQSPANKFSNPLMSSSLPEVKKGLLGDCPADARLSSEEKGVKKGLLGDYPGDKSHLAGAIKQPASSISPDVSTAPAAKEPDVERTERKKKKPRQRERKKTREKNKRENQDSSTTAVRRPSQASNASSDSKEKAEVINVSSPDQSKSLDDTSGSKQTTENADDEKLSEKEEPKNEDNSPEKHSPVDDVEVVGRKLEEMGLEQAEKRLEKDMIHKLEKKSPTFPEAKYFCKLCSHHLNSVALAHKHIKDKRHKKETKAWKQDELLRHLKPPPAAALAVLDRQLLSVVEKNMLSQDDVRERVEVVERLNEVVQNGLPGCNVVAYGSSVTGIGLRASDLNLDVQYKGDMRTPNVLLELLKILKECDEFVDVQQDFDAKFPQIEVFDKLTNTRCILSTGNSNVVQTTQIMKHYGEIEPAMTQLASLLRLWGHLCEVDCQEDGSLAPRSFALMTIFYLQQKHGLPVLHEIMGEHDMNKLLSGDDESIILENKSGEWWYNPTAPPAGKKETKSEEKEEDADETVDCSDSDEDIDVTFEELPKEPATPTTTSTDPLLPVKLEKCFNDNENPSLAKLWLGLLKFYSAQFDMENLIITIRTAKKVTRSDRGWSHRRLAVEDPGSPKWNLCKPMNSQTLFSYFLTRLKHSVFYFHTAHNSGKPKNKKKSPEKNSKKLKSREIKIFGKTTDEVADMILESAYVEVTKGHKSRLNDDWSDLVNRAIEVKGQPSTSNSDVTNSISDYADDMVDGMLESLKVMNLKTDNKEEKSDINYNFCYKFTKEMLTDGKMPIVVCNSCKKEGHRKKHCPDEAKIKVYPLPPMTKQLKYMLDHVCREMYDTYVPLEDEVQMRDKVCSDLHRFLQDNYDENVQMCLFGSSRNRFTFRGSDLDICMTFEDDQTGGDLDFIQVIEDLAKVLRKNPDLRHIIPITTAKVPIVKFYHPKAGLEGDISLYNLLAQRNTSMLGLYASIDERCRMLGYAMKAFVKRCCIGDASRGSLSSYAYTLLVIYFLQQRDPPVLPVLQELYTGDKSPEHIVDCWNSWFYNSIGNLNNVWPEFGKNTETLGELWIGLLKFYTEVFDFSRHVASIKQKKLLTAFEKEWTSKCICIEDPFDLSHNLGAGVSRKMTNFIMKVFVKARERFGTDPGNQLNGARGYQYYFFNAEILMDGQEVPNDRCCRICGKIGHFVKDCPKRRNRGKRNDESKLRDVECFACGKKGHFKKDCPGLKQGHGSPRKDGPFPQGHHPLLLLPGQPRYIMPPVGPNMGSPVVVHAKRQDSLNMNFQDPRNTPNRQNSNTGARTPQKTSEILQKTPDMMQKKQNQERKEQHSQKNVKTPQNRHNRQQSVESTPPQNNQHHPKSPHPSSGPNNQPKNTPGNGATPKQVNRSLSSDFNGARPLDTKNTVAKSPSNLSPLPSDPSISRCGLTLKDTNQKGERKRKLPGDSPSLGTIPTVTEIENQMIEKEKKNKPKVGESLNHLIPRQTSNEELRNSQNNRFQQHHGYSQSPPYPPYSPITPLSPHMYSPYTYPRNGGNPFNFSPHPGHGRPGQHIARTPPNLGGFNNQPRMGQSPNDQSHHLSGLSPPPTAGYRFPGGGRVPIGKPQSNPNNEHISGITFVNSNERSIQHGHREVHYASPSGGQSYPGVNLHHSYPPNTSNPQFWNAQSPRK